METPRHDTPARPSGIPLADRGAAAEAPVVRTVVADGDPVERTVSVHAAEPVPPVVRTVEAPSQAPTRTVESDHPASDRSGRVAWWIGGGTLGAGALAAAVTAAVRRRRTPEPTPVERLTRPEAYLPGLAVLAGTTGTVLGVRRVVHAARVARTARRARVSRQGRAVAVSMGGIVDAGPAQTRAVDTGAEPVLETAPLPREMRTLVETLLDRSRAEGRDLPGADALRAQLPHVRTVADALPVDDEDGIDWLPLVVESDVELDRAVPHDFTWPVRGRFTEEGQPFELTLLVIDGELGGLTIAPEDEDDIADWDEIPAVTAWPGLDELTFRVDGPRR